WYALGLSQGSDLRTACSRFQENSERLEFILTTMHRLCSALSYLHGQGIIHRDLKPENILVPTNEFPVLVDFGLASQFPGGAGREELKIEEGLSGTVAYMPPEYISGETLDARLDHYLLCYIHYTLFMITVQYNN